MEPVKLLDAPERRLVGQSLRMNLKENAVATGKLWSGFMPNRGQVDHVISDHLYSVQVYDGEFDFSPDTEFTKWAAVEIDAKATVPAKMNELVIPSGRYAVFIHHGPAREFPKTMRGILAWLSANGLKFDARPHFERIPPDYPGPDSPDAREEIWIPTAPVE